MYNRSKYNLFLTKNMLNAMKFMKSWLNKNKKRKYSYLSLNINEKFMTNINNNLF